MPSVLTSISFAFFFSPLLSQNLAWSSLFVCPSLCSLEWFHAMIDFGYKMQKTHLFLGMIFSDYVCGSKIVVVMMSKSGAVSLTFPSLFLRPENEWFDQKQP
jgi:hypothetical protein